MSTSVLRRYTPPTCTLEIAATGSVLSRWTDRTVLKNLRFHLSFDDPKLPPEQQIILTGDRLQLEALCEVVETYVQSLLNQAPDPLNALLIPSDPANPDQAQLPIARTKSSELSSSSDPSAGIYLKPKSLLSHELCLGALGNGELGAAVHLSALQLFDLANALDEYHAEALTLPALGRPAWLQAPAGWARVAAVLVLAIGATGAVTKFVLDISSPVSQVAASNQEVEIATQPSAAVSPTPLPLPDSGVPSSELQLKPLFPPKPPAGAVQPVPTPSDAVNLPPTGMTAAPPTSVPAGQLPAAAEAGIAAADNTSAAANPNSQVVVLPPADGSSTGSSTGSPTPTQNPLSFADAPPDLAASTSAAISPLEAQRSRLDSTSIPAEPIARSQAIGNEAPQVATNRSTAFDNYPQIAEIREYFSQKWQPPTELTQMLEYRLVLDANGTIQRIIPLGDASERYVDRTDMPLMGEAFVSPLQGRDQLQVRLVLSPDGKVQAFSDGN